MLIYATIFILSISGAVALILFRWGELESKAQEARALGRRMNFADFMESIVDKIRLWWSVRLKTRLFTVLARQIGVLRVVILKAEKALFILARKLRGGTSHSRDIDGKKD